MSTEGHLSKYRALMPQLALLFHPITLAAGTGSPAVSLEAFEQAMAWGEFLEAHAEKLYAGEEQERARRRQEGETPEGSARRLVQAIAGLEPQVRHGKLALTTIATAVNAGLPQSEQRTAKALGSELRTLGLPPDGTTASGAAAIYWDGEKIKALLKRDGQRSGTSGTSVAMSELTDVPDLTDHSIGSNGHISGAVMPTDGGVVICPRCGTRAVPLPSGSGYVCSTCERPVAARGFAS